MDLNQSQNRIDSNWMSDVGKALPVSGFVEVTPRLQAGCDLHFQSRGPRTIGKVLGGLLQRALQDGEALSGAFP